jgi:hypothetical protein
MSTRAFSRTLPDQVNFSPGGAPVNQDNMTAMALIKMSDLYGWVLTGTKAGSSVWAFGRDGGKWFTWNDFSAGATFDPAGHWCWIGFSRATGNATWHFKDYTAGGAWTHVSSGFNPGAGSGPIDSIQVSGYGGGAAGTHLNGVSVAVMFTATSAWADAKVEAACTSSAADIVTQGASWLTRWNQSSVATAIPDDIGSGNQSSITGTTLDADEPPSYSFALSPTTTPVTSTLGVPWAIRNTVSRSVSTPWALRASVSGSLSVPWAQRATVSQSLSAPWAVRGVATGTLTAPWTLRSQISALLGTPWTVRRRVTSNLQTLWVVQGEAHPKTSNVQATLTDRVQANLGPDRITAYLGTWP